MDQFKKKGLPEYQHLMQRCFQEYYRVLKPGRWMTVVFHNSSNAVWNAIQEAMQTAGFVVADVRTLDKQQGSYRQVTSTAVKQDLVISAYKPNGGLEDRFRLEAGTEDGAWDFVRTHLKQLPVFVSKDGQAEIIAERQNYLLFDRMVAFHVQRGVTVPLSAAEFYAGLEQRFPACDGMYFLSDQVAEYDKKRMTVREVLQLQLFVIRRGVGYPVAQPAVAQEAPDLPGDPPAVPQGTWRLAETRGSAGAVPDAGTELPALRRPGRSAEPDPQLPLHQLQGAAQPAQGRRKPTLQGQGPLVRARPEQGRRPGEAAREGAAQGIRGVSDIEPEALESLSAGGGARRVQEGVAGKSEKGTALSSRWRGRYPKMSFKKTRNCSCGTIRQ